MHQRLLIFALKYEQWENVVSKIYDMTAPGGWAQLLEVDTISHGPSDYGPATTRVMEVLKALEKASGLDLGCSLRLQGLMKKVGFVNVQVTLRDVPIGTSHGEMGAKFSANNMTVFRGLKTPVLRLGGFGLVHDERDYDNLMDQMELEWNNGKPGCGAGWYTVVGRKV